MSGVANVIDFPRFVEDNKERLEPPVCNQLLFENQLKVMIVGGPNTRTDYHLEMGEVKRRMNVFSFPFLTFLPGAVLAS